MLQSHPQSVHLTHVLQYKVDSIVDVAILWSLKLGTNIGQLVLHHLQQVITEEEATNWLLYSLDHVQQVSQNELDWCLLGLDVGRTDSDQQVKPGNDISSVLNRLIEVTHLAPLLLLINKVALQVRELVKGHHIW